MKRKLVVIFLLVMSLLLALPTEVLAQSNIDNIGTAHNFETVVTRRSLYAAGRMWVFYIKPDYKLYSKSSADNGTTWSSAIKASDLTVSHSTLRDIFDVVFDGTFIHIIMRNLGVSPYNFFYKRGLPNVNGTITWGNEFNTGIASDSGWPGTATMAIDSGGYPWILYGDSGNTPYLTKASTNDGTWATASGYPLQLRLSINCFVYHAGFGGVSKNMEDKP